jgi:type 1 glutamine amidotransferase
VNVLVLCGDFWHPALIARTGLKSLDGTEFAFDCIEDTREWSPETMQNYRVVILTKSGNVSSADQSGWMSDHVQAAFVDYVRKGNGLLAIHSGTAIYAEKLVLRKLLGGVFNHHPEQCPVRVTPHPGHPLSLDSKPFTVKDEHYFMDLDDPGADVFVNTESGHGEQPGGWRRMEGRGRVAVLTPGHNLEVWLDPSFQALVRNCLQWCGSALHTDR